MTSFGSVKYSNFQQKIREFDVCSARVERSQETRIFQETLVNIIGREVSDRPDIIQELQSVMVSALNSDSCGNEPTFLTEFKE